MSGKTKIEWCDRVWNPVTGCTPVSAGCEHCYAARMAKRLAGRFGYPAENPFKVTLHEDKLGYPKTIEKPSRIFVNSMGDLFHEDVTNEILDQVFLAMHKNNQHTYMILTKRADRMNEYISSFKRTGKFFHRDEALTWGFSKWPLPNVWLGVTVEDPSKRHRIDDLLDTPAAIRFVSLEPLLMGLDIQKYLDRCHADRDGDCNHPSCPQIRDGEPLKTGRHCPIDTRPHDEEEEPRPLLDWVICGGETGPGARPMHPDWVRSLRDQCVSAGVPFFFKGWGEWKPISEMTEAETEKYYEPAPIRDPEAIRRCKVETRAIRFDGGDDFFSINGHVSYSMFKVGKKRSGRGLDGREWSEFPNPPTPFTKGA